MRIVPDTNVILSASVWDGKPKLLLDLARSGRIEIVTSAPLLAELATVVLRAKFAGTLARAKLTPLIVMEDYKHIVTIVHAARIPRTVSDPDDDAVLGTASAAHADLIVSGDRHLLTIGAFESIPILNVADALRRIEAMLT